jgi:hypothetical protein
MFNFEWGAKLPNGATILDCAQVHSCDYTVVVAKYGNKFVRWCCDKQGNCYWGQYCKTHDEAYQLFVAKLLETH